MTKIAIVGSGISGLMAAHTLSPRHEVELFESNHRAGGHANTVLVNDAGTPTPIDTGSSYLTTKTTLCSVLFDRLGVASHDSDMSFSVHCETTDVNGTVRAQPSVWTAFERTKANALANAPRRVEVS